MQIKTNIPKDISYDPTTGAFMALVTVQTDSGAYRYPCTCPGPIDMPMAFAALKLTQQAKARHANHDDLHSFRCAEAPRAGRPTPLWSYKASLPLVA